MSATIRIVILRVLHDDLPPDMILLQSDEHTGISNHMAVIVYLWLHPGLGNIPPLKSALGFNNGFADHKPILLVMVVFIGCQPTKYSIVWRCQTRT